MEARTVLAQQEPLAGNAMPPHPDFAYPAPWGYVMSVVWVLVAFGISAFAAIGYCGFLYGFDRLTEILEALKTEPNAAFDGVLISQIYIAAAITQIAMLVIIIRMKRWPIANYLALNLPERRALTKALALLVAIIICIDGVTSLFGQNPTSQFQTTSYSTAKEAGGLLLLFVVVVLVAPITEEIIFRGFLYRGLMRVRGHEPYVVFIISLGFAAAHYQQYNLMELLSVFIIGLLLGGARWLSGSTTLTILMHVLANFVATIETVIYVEWLAK